MRINKLFAVVISCLLAFAAYSQESAIDHRAKLEEAKMLIQQWDIEHLLDSLDQEQLPHIVTGGILGNANMSNFIIAHAAGEASSYMKVGGEFGGFMDFYVTKHFGIQWRAVFTVEQNRFAIDTTYRQLWSFGIDIPIYLLGKFGNMQKGYLQFGGGIFTHFTFAANKGSEYSNNLAEKIADPQFINQILVLHDNHSGLTATLGYEFPIGIQVNANYMVSLTDIFAYYHKVPDSGVKAIYPQRVSLGIAYRWK